MAIQSSINSLLSQAQSLAAFYKGFTKAGEFIKGQDNIIKGQEAQTEATKNLQKTIEERYKEYKGIPSNVTLHPSQLKAVQEADDILQNTGYQLDNETIDKIASLSSEIAKENKDFYNDGTSVAEYLKSYNNKNAALDSVIETHSANSELKNDVAEKLARASVEARTNSINKAKSNFNEHTASLIRYYGKGSGNP